VERVRQERINKKEKENNVSHQAERHQLMVFHLTSDYGRGVAITNTPFNELKIINLYRY
jgi:hypothetical protein